LSPLSTHQNEGARWSSYSPTSASDGLGQDPRQVNWLLLSPGWSTPPAKFRDPTRSKCISVTRDGTSFGWDRWNIDKLRLSVQASLLVLQGLPLKDLLDHANLQESLPAGNVLHEGPFLLLRAKYVPSDSPPRLSGVVLARLHEDVVTRDLPEILGTLVQAVLAP
jgi:hypothetical protein